MTKKTGTKWSTVDCGRCGKPHSGYSGKLDAKGQEYVVCGATNKRMDVSQSTEHMLSRVYATNWTSDNTVAIQESKIMTKDELINSLKITKIIKIKDIK